tara:strand:- start:172 stop:450 length:279 start_codon:yes stop_codon:yes gene_type:complete
MSAMSKIKNFWEVETKANRSYNRSTHGTRMLPMRSIIPPQYEEQVQLPLWLPLPMLEEESSPQEMEETSSGVVIIGDEEDTTPNSRVIIIDL